MVNIEKRTEDFRQQMGDIPLAEAMIAWNTGKKGWNRNGEMGDGRVAVIPHPDRRDLQSYLGLRMTSGACYADWHTCSSEERLTSLMCVAWKMACRDGVPLGNIHRALMAIPEYRANLPVDFCIMEEES
jgi:hypothetical protein